jgi:polyisoprenoid-binding protein YceI
MEATKEIQSLNWDVDYAHSKIGFSARHMIISEVHGQFDSYKLNIESIGDNFEDNKVEVEIDSKSINTGIPDRDNHLKSADFFDVENYPVITFRSKSIKKIDDENFKLIGNLTIKNIIKEIELDLNYGGKIVDPWGNNRIGFNITGNVNRFDYDLKWNALIETGGAVVGKTIKLSSDLEIISKPTN